MFLSSDSVGLCPRDLMTIPNSSSVILPSKSLSKRLKASLNSAICSSVKPYSSCNVSFCVKADNEVMSWHWLSTCDDVQRRVQGKSQDKSQFSDSEDYFCRTKKLTLFKAQEQIWSKVVQKTRFVFTSYLPRSKSHDDDDVKRRHWRWWFFSQENQSTILSHAGGGLQRVTRIGG